MLKENLINTKMIEVLKEENCFLCRLQHQYTKKYISDLIYEYTTDQVIISKFINSLGFCSEHTHLLIKLMKGNYYLSRSSVAKLYESTIPVYLDTLSRNKTHENIAPLENIILQVNKIKKMLKKHNNQQRNCMCCLASKEETSNNILTLIELLLDEEYRKLYRSSDGLCILHLNDVLTFIEKNGVVSPVKDFLIKDQEERLELLQYRLQRLQEKKRYDNNEIITEAEALSWQEAIWRFGGWKPEKINQFSNNK